MSHTRTGMIAVLLLLAARTHPEHAAAQEQAPEQRKPAAPDPKARSPKPASQDGAAEVLIIGQTGTLEHIPGSGEVLPRELIRDSRPRDIHELIRKVPGVHARDEEGLGLRPNYGVRGLPPTRSSKVLLLEDGVPFVIGPYGDNTTYYHPPVGRFERVEILKGAGQILYGPNTVGAVFNYITPKPPTRPGGSLSAAAGSLGYLSVGGTLGAGTEEAGALLDFNHKESDGRARNIHLGVDDLLLRMSATLAPRTSVSLKFNYLKEDSQVTYAGLTQSEFKADPRQNPFDDDEMTLGRMGVHGALRHGFSDDHEVLVNLYGYTVQRDWWRQWHNDNNGNAMPAADTATIPNNRKSGRIREYYVYGLEPRFQSRHALFGIRQETDYGARIHTESQDRRLLTRLIPAGTPVPLAVSADPPASGRVDEDNERYATALSAYLQNRFLLSEEWSVSAGLRMEHIRYKRINNLGGGGFGVRGDERLIAWIPGLGVNYLPVPELTLFAGVHRGFAPPRIEDAIDNNGVAVELKPEKSWNYELGARWNPAAWLASQLTLFRMDFDNQIVPASVAGGVGATLTNGGETLHQGLEVGLNWDILRMAGLDHGLTLSAAWTWVGSAEFRGTRFSNVTGTALLPGEAAVEDVRGNRVPYAPEQLLTVGLAYEHPAGLRALVEAVYVGDQYSDDRETRTPTPNGRRGLLDGYLIWNVTLNYSVECWKTSFFVSMKNLADEEYIVDRTRGIYAGMERQFSAGAEWRF